MKVTNFGLEQPYSIIRGLVAGTAAVGTATLATLNLVVISPAALAANTNDWAPTGIASADIIRASASAAYDLTGLTAATDDRLLIIDNIGTFTITLKHAAAGSVAANRFLCPGDADLAMAADTNAWLQYDITSARWRVIGGTGVATVTSVGLTAPTEFAVSGSPVTGSGTLVITKATEAANTVWAGPTSGAAAQPTFRALGTADIPAGVTDHLHVNDIQFSGDGVTTAFELPAAPFDAYAVAAFVAGVRQDVTLSGAILTTMTFATAPALGTGNIMVDVIAVAV